VISVRPARREDARVLAAFRAGLWPEESEAGHRLEVDRFFEGSAPEPLAILVADDAGRAVGFAEMSIRPWAEGCVTNRVAYLEGWYVAPEARGRGVGRALVAAAEEWAVAQGCRELASDTQPDNEGSAAAHRALGFTDVGLVRCFRKDLREMETRGGTS
jgi:aminoglycoside 6'-N-acetyltransferase I